MLADFGRLRRIYNQQSLLPDRTNAGGVCAISHSHVEGLRLGNGFAVFYAGGYDPDQKERMDMRWSSLLARFFLFCCAVVYFPQTYAAQGSQLATFSGTNGVEAQVLDNGAINYCTNCHSVAGLQTPYMESYANMTATPAMFYPGCTTGGTTVAECANVRGNDESMPMGGPPLSTTHKNLLSEWIADGTLNSSSDSYIDNTAATSVGKYGATFNAEVNENGVSTTFEFEYGVGTAFNLEIGSLSGTGTGGGGATYGTESISQAVTGLTCGTNYQYRAQETSDDSYQDAVAISFNTSTCPTVTTIPDDTITEDENFSYDVGNTNVTTETVTYSLDATSLSRGMTINSSTGLISWSAANVPDTPEVNTNYSVTVTASYTVAGGSAPNDADTFTITVTPVNDAPVFSTAGTTTATEDSAYSYDANYTDTESDTVTFSLQSAPSGMTINSSTGVVSWTPTNAQAQPGVNVHAVTIRATDNGTVNGSPSAQFTDQSFNITVSNVNDAPTFSSVAGTSATEDTLYTYDADATDQEGNTLTFSLFVAPSGMSINSSTGVVSWTPTNAQALAGSHNVTVRVTDNGSPNLATDQSFSITVTNTNDAPTVTSNAPTTCIEDNACNFVPTANDIDGETTFTWGLTNAPAGMSINSSTGAITWTPVNGQATSGVVTVTATDAGLLSGNANFTIAVDGQNDAPLITSTAITTATEDVAYSYTVAVTDPDDANNGIDLVWSLLSAPVGMSVSSTGAISWTPTEGVLTSGTVTVRVADGGENGAAAATQSFTITVTAVPDAPVINSTAVTTATEDIVYSYDVNATDAENDTLTYSLTSAPAGMTINSVSGVISWTPAEGISSSGTVTVQVSDGALTTQQTFVIAVTAVNDAPLITSSAPTTATEDTLYTYTATVSDPDDLNNGTQLTWSLLNAPSGMVVSATGVVTWTPINGVTSSGAVTLRVADGGENGAAAATQNFTVTVGAVNDAPIMSAIAAQNVTELSPLVVIAAVTDPDDANDGSGALTFSLSNAPSGMSINNVGVISWTPGEDSRGSYSVTVTVADGGEDAALPSSQLFTITVSILDSDIDTIADYDDNCPSNANTDQLNTDGDSEGNVCDLDDDNDLMPDDFELAKGLNPLDPTDAMGDIDGDGLNNLAEYQTCVAASDPDCANLTVDNVPPEIVTNGDLVINATGYMSTAGESATATDVHDGVVAVTADVRSPFRPGRHIVTWTATDGAGNTATQDQQIDVLPLVTIDANTVTGENRAVQLAVRLNGEAPTYPVDIDYTVAGSATNADHDAVSGRVTLSSGDIAYIAFNTLSDGSTESDETIEFTLSAVSANAVLSADRKGTVTIVDRQVAPNVVLQVEQNSLLTQQVFSDAGVVTLRAIASDPNGGNLTYNWSNTSNALGIFASGNTATFNPLSIAAGNYTVAVTVSDGIASVERETMISVAPTTVELSNVTDTDQDGIDDQTEGLADSDGDGISDYLDPVLARHQLNITNDNETDRFYRLMETVPGLQLSVGDLGLAAHRVGARLSSLDVLDANGNVVNDATFQLVGELFDFRVTGLSDVNPNAIVMIPLKTAIMPNSVYRKFINGEWRHFDVQNGDSIATAALVGGKCPRLDDASAWITGINASHMCLKLVIRDGGANDGDGVVNGAVADPGGLAVIKNKAEPQAPTESQTGSGHMAWWTLLAMMLLLMFRRSATQLRSVHQRSALQNSRPTWSVRE